MKTKIKSAVLALAGATVIVMPIISWIIMGFYPDIDFIGYMSGHASLIMQIILGISVGVVTAIIAQWIVDRKFMREVQLKYAELIGSLELNRSERIYISFCAGVGEEILFRGTLQPLWGIIITSVVFVAIHGYLSLTDWKISLYGIYMTLVICLFGWLTVEAGILVAIIAHTIIDIYLLERVAKNRAETETQEE